MRVFLSSFDNFILAVPAENVSHILRIDNNTNTDSRFISLPEIFNLKNLVIRHGIAIKNSNLILLTCRIDSETDILQKEIFSLPKSFNVIDFSRFFYGMSFIHNQLVLFLNPEKLLKHINKELI